MADSKISDLGAASALVGTELVPIVQGGVTVKSTAQDIANLSGAAGTVDAEMSFAASDRTTPLTVAAGGGIYAPFNMTLENLFAGIEIAGSGGGSTTIMIKNNGVNMLSAAITIDSTRFTSLSSATFPVISVTSILQGNFISTDITSVTAGRTEAGLQIILNGKRA